ncbi:GNAT family N-acetyltransferase [Streptomyces sp. NPDC048659]|uniref:GNAT family N-acetyltransferase n=1 Tax=Streptomyces sp. NPDC048659 TaxID=3155489 RepID=UPI00341F6C23
MPATPPSGAEAAGAAEAFGASGASGASDASTVAVDADAELRRLHGFIAAFTRRQAARTVPVPGGFAALDDAYALSHGNNHVLIDGPTDPEALPAVADEALAGLPHRAVYVLDAATGDACAEPMARAGYALTRTVLMRHTGPAPAPGGAREVGLPALRGPVAASWRRFLPDAPDEVVRVLVERRAARLRGTDDVRFLASLDETGEPASWADLYLDPAAGLAQIEDLVTAADHLGRGHAGAVLDTALHLAERAGCPDRFLIALADDWPRRWYERRGFVVVGGVHCFERT